MDWQELFFRWVQRSWVSVFDGIFFERKFHAITCLGGHKYRDLLNEFFEGGCMKVTPHFLLGNISYMFLYMYDIYKPFMDPKYLLRNCFE